MHQSAYLLAKNVFEILSKLPRHGLGSRLTRTTWKDDSFWTITQVRMSPDGKHGKAYGILTWRGVEEEQTKPRQVRGPLKRIWKQLATDSTSSKLEWQSLVSAAVQSEQAAAAAAAAAAESESAAASTEPTSEEGASLPSEEGSGDGSSSEAPK